MSDVNSKQVGGDHYRTRKIQPWDVVDEYKLSFYSGCSVKYILREKGGLDKKIEDIKKAIHCLEKEVDRLEGCKRTMDNEYEYGTLVHDAEPDILTAERIRQSMESIKRTVPQTMESMNRVAKQLSQ